MRIIYISDDGKEFNNIYDCKKYEEIIQHHEIYTIEFYDCENNVLYVEKGKEYLEDDIHNLYNISERIRIHNDEEYKDFVWWTKVNGCCEFEQIDSPGEWVREEPDIGEVEGTWKKVGD